MEELSNLAFDKARLEDKCKPDINKYEQLDLDITESAVKSDGIRSRLEKLKQNYSRMPKNFSD